MKKWNERSPEVANLLNPAFCARLLFSAIHNYELTAKRDFPFPLIYLVLPLVLHRATRERINSGTQLLAWIQSNPELLVCFPQRASDLVPITNEAVELLLQAGSIAITHWRIANCEK